MEAVCCCVRKLVTSLSLFFLAPLRVSPSLSPSIFFISHLYLSLCLSLTRSLSFSFPLSSLQPSFCPRRHPRLILPESWPSEPDKNSAPVFVQSVCARLRAGVYLCLQASMKYELLNMNAGLCSDAIQSCHSCME